MSILPMWAAKYPVRSVLTGLCFALVTGAATWAAIVLTNLFFPSVFNSIAALVVGPLAAVIVLAIGAGLGFGVSYALAGRLGLPRPARTIVFGATISIELAWLGVSYILVPLPQITLYLIALPLVALTFLLVDTLNFVRLPAPAIAAINLVVIAILGVAVFSADNAKLKDGYKTGIMKAGYALYIPPASFGPPQPDYITPQDGNSNYDLTKGANVEFRGGQIQVQVYEFKYPGTDPTPTCGPAYVKAQTDGYDHACSLVKQTPIMKIYADTQSADGAVVTREYYGVTPSTVINVQATDPDTGDTNDAFSLRFLDAMRPVSADAFLATLHHNDPDDF